MIRYAYAAVAAAVACAPAQAVVIYSGQAEAGQTFGYTATLQPGERLEYVLEIDGGPLTEADLRIDYRRIDYRRVDADTLIMTPVSGFAGCFRAGGQCVTEVPEALLPLTWAFTISASFDDRTRANCDLPSAIGAGVCYSEALPTVWSFSAKAQGPTTFTLSFVPEPATWAMLILGFGAIGVASRISRRPSIKLAR